MPLEVFIQRNFVADFFRQNLNFTGTNSDIAFLCHPLGDLGVTYTVHLWHDGKRVVNFLLAIIELFLLALTAVALLSEICRNRRFSMGVGQVDGDVARNASMDR